MLRFVIANLTSSGVILNIGFRQINRILLQPIEIHFITHTIAEIYLAFGLFTKVKPT